MKVQLYAPADGDNWVDIFIDDKKVYGGHNITPFMLLHLLWEYGSDIDLAPTVLWEDTENTQAQQKRLELGVSM